MANKVEVAIGGKVDPSLGSAFDQVFGRLSAAGGILGSLQGKVAALLGAESLRRISMVGVNYNASLETSTVAFKTLLGSMSAAQARMADLAKFAASTPFELTELVAASRLLQSLTQGALASGKGLQIVGDAAAASGRSFQETAMWVGRLFLALKSGAPGGEALARLTEMGLLRPEDRKRFEGASGRALGDAGAMAEIVAVFGRFSGAMEDLSKTFTGRMSTLMDNFNAKAGEMTKGMFVSLSAGLARLNAMFDSGTIQFLLTEIITGMKALVLASHIKGGMALVKGARGMWGLNGAADFKALQDLAKGAGGGIKGWWKTLVEGGLSAGTRTLIGSLTKLTIAFAAAEGALKILTLGKALIDAPKERKLADEAQANMARVDASNRAKYGVANAEILRKRRMELYPKTTPPEVTEALALQIENQKKARDIWLSSLAPQARAVELARERAALEKEIAKTRDPLAQQKLISKWLGLQNEKNSPASLGNLSVPRSELASRGLFASSADWRASQVALTTQKSMLDELRSIKATLKAGLAITDIGGIG